MTSATQDFDLPLSRRRGLPGGVYLKIVPGLLLTATIAATSFALHSLPGVAAFSPMILAILIGIAFHNLVGTPARAKAGVTFSLRRIFVSPSSCSACN